METILCCLIHFTLIAYFFKPHSLGSLFNVAGNELGDTHVDLNLLKQSHSTTDIQEKLLNCLSADNMVLLLNSYILNLINKKRIDTSRIDFATTIIRENLASANLKSVQHNLCVTEKTLQRMFESNVGISPGLYKRICQFSAAFQQLNLRKFLKLSDIAYNNGYARPKPFDLHFQRIYKLYSNRIFKV